MSQLEEVRRPGEAARIRKQMKTPRQLTEARFLRLRNQWHKQCGPSSFAADLASLPAYRKIVELGVDVVPVLLRELQAAPDHWFWALEEITGENPVDFQDRGRLDAMSAAWIRWGKARGII